MSLIYPFCTVEDVERLSVHGEAFSVSTQPTLAQVGDFIRDIEGHIRSVLTQAGYDQENLHEISGTVALAITAGDDVDVDVATGQGASFEAQQTVKIEGLTSGVQTWEYVTVKSVSGDTITLTTVENNYDIGTVTLYVVNTALRILRDLNALGATAKTEDSYLTGMTRSDTEHQSKYWSQYNGSEKTQYGLWAILNVNGFLDGASITTESVVRGDLESYGREHESDADVEPWFTRDMEF